MFDKEKKDKKNKLTSSKNILEAQILEAWGKIKESELFIGKIEALLFMGSKNIDEITNDLIIELKENEGLKQEFYMVLRLRQYMDLLGLIPVEINQVQVKTSNILTETTETIYSDY